MKAYGYRLNNSQDDKYYSLPYFPVGFIIHMMENTNPNGLLIGKWERLKGRVLVGVDENDPDFNVPNKTGGSKYLQKHNHQWQPDLKYDVENFSLGGAFMMISGFARYNTYGRLPTENAGTGDSGNLQPYITCYMWVRIA